MCEGQEEDTEGLDEMLVDLFNEWQGGNAAICGDKMPIETFLEDVKSRLETWKAEKKFTGGFFIKKT